MPRGVWVRVPQAAVKSEVPNPKKPRFFVQYFAAVVKITLRLFFGVKGFLPGKPHHKDTAASGVVLHRDLAVMGGYNIICDTES